MLYILFVTLKTVLDKITIHEDVPSVEWEIYCDSN